MSELIDRLASGDVVELMPAEDRSSMLADLIDLITDSRMRDDVLLADLRIRVWRCIEHYAAIEAESGGD